MQTHGRDAHTVRQIVNYIRRDGSPASRDYSISDADCVAPALRYQQCAIMLMTRGHSLAYDAA